MVLRATLTDIVVVTKTDGIFLVADGTDWVGESGATMRTSAGLGTANNVQFATAGLGGAVIADHQLSLYQTVDASCIKIHGTNVANTFTLYVNASGEGRVTSSGDFVWASGGFHVMQTAVDESIYFNAGGKFFIRDIDAANAERVVIDTAASPATGRIVVAEDSTTAIVLGAGNDVGIGWNGSALEITQPMKLGGDVDANGGTIHFGTAENTQTPAGTTATIDLGAENHHTLDCGTASGTITLTLTVPLGPTAGTIIIEQDASPKDITWALSAGTVKWLGTEPTWSGDTSAWRIVSWRWDGTFMYLSATESS